MKMLTMDLSPWKQALHYLRRILAKLYLRLYPKLTIIGITGSYGKTNTARAIFTVLSEKFPSLQTDLNLDTIYNLPITILKLRPWHRVLVLEMGVDHRGEMDLHLGLVKPQIAVITGITPVHSDPELLGSIKGIIKEKGKLLQALPAASAGLAILNWDDPYVRQMRRMTKAKIIKYGSERKDVDLLAKNIMVDFNGTFFDLEIKNYSSKKTVRLKTGLVGRHFVHACLAAAAVGLNQGMALGEIEKGLEKLKPLEGRLSIEPGYRGSILINDSLRANPASTIAGLQTLADLPCRQEGLPTRGKRIAVLGEMGELGIYAEKEHLRVGRQVAQLKIDYLVAIGPLQKLVAQEARKNGIGKDRVFWVKDVHEAAQVLKKLVKNGDLFYLKASLLRHVERILLILKGEKVGCRVISCHFYHHCRVCPYLLSGLAKDKIK